MSDPIALVATIATTTLHRHAVEEALKRAVAATVAEAGCLHYVLHRDRRDPNRYAMIERWRDQASLDLHAGGPAFTALAAALDGRATLQVASYIPLDA
jgi:quinol monooxygenase YgiN